MCVFFFIVYGSHRDLHVLSLSFPTRRSSDLEPYHRHAYRAHAVHTRDRGGDRRLGAPRPEAARRSCPAGAGAPDRDPEARSEEHTSELQSLMRISYAVFCLKKKKRKKQNKCNLKIMEHRHIYNTTPRL